MRVSRNRGDDGRHVEKASLTDVVALLTQEGGPLTGKEIGDQLGISSRSSLEKLNTLHERGMVERKKVGGGAVVW